MRGSLLQITMFIEWTDTQTGKAEPPSQLGKVSPTVSPYFCTSDRSVVDYAENLLTIN
jgi:hypothetical protein